MDRLHNHGDWVYFDNNVTYVSSGNGIESLRTSLPNNQCGFAVFRLDAENVGNSGKGIITTANIILQWKGPSSSNMNKVRNNGSLQGALDRLLPNKGFIEVLGTRNLNVNNIYDRWRPGSGSKVIDD